jgi:hypothetical protein
MSIFNKKTREHMEICVKVENPGSGSAFRMRIRIQELNYMRISADPNPKH